MSRERQQFMLPGLHSPKPPASFLRWRNSRPGTCISLPTKGMRTPDRHPARGAWLVCSCFDIELVKKNPVYRVSTVSVSRLYTIHAQKRIGRGFHAHPYTPLAFWAAPAYVTFPEPPQPHSSYSLKANLCEAPATMRCWLQASLCCSVMSRKPSA